MGTRGVASEYSGDVAIGRIPTLDLGERVDTEKSITAIEGQQRARERVNLFLDGEFAMGVHVDVVAALHLQVGQRITEERLRDIVREESLSKAKERAFLLLSFRARSEKEVRDRLRQSGYEDDIVEDVVARLYALDLLNDQDFADRFVQSRMSGRPVGRRAMAYELRRKGLDTETVTEATAGVDDDAERAAALAAARSRAGRFQGMEAREARRKLGAFLQRRGFGWDTISSVMDEVLASD